MKVIRVMSAATAVLLFGALAPANAQREGGKPEEKQAEPAQHAQPARAQKAAPQQRTAQPQERAAPKAAPPQHAAQTHAAQPRPQEKPRETQAKPQPEQRAAEAKPQEQPRSQPAAQQHAQPAQQARQQAPPQRTQQQARTWQQQKSWTHGGGSAGHATFAQDRSQSWSSDHRTWGQRGGYGGYIIPQAAFNLSFGSGHFFRLGGLPAMYLGYPRFSYGGFSFLMVDPWPGNWAANWYTSDDVYIGYNDGYYLYDRRYPEEAVAITIEL